MILRPTSEQKKTRNARESSVTDSFKTILSERFARLRVSHDVHGGKEVSKREGRQAEQRSCTRDRGKQVKRARMEDEVRPATKTKKEIQAMQDSKHSTYSRRW
jgi:hypothetical protein